MIGLRLPDGILKSRVRYSSDGANGRPKLDISFGNDNPNQAREIVELLAEHIRIQTGTQQEIVPISSGLYYIGNAGAALSKVNYLIFYDDSDRSELVRARLEIITDAACTIEFKTLETFVKEIILQ
jgi:hypothetical protein